MRLKYLLITAAVVGMSGLATAGPSGEETLAIDLTAVPGGSTYFVKCSQSREIGSCGIASLWEQSNKLPGLQTGIFAYGGRPYQPDAKLIA